MKAKRNIYLAQVDILRRSPLFCSAYLPYAVGGLWAYARQAPAVADAYELKELFFLRDSVEDLAARLENPFLVGFSCYVWNTEYNKALARLVKERFPSCIILFGGHNVLPGGATLEEAPYVDFVIHGEGEIPFQALLMELCKEKENKKEAPDWTAVPGLSYRTKHGTASNPETVAASVADFPSPFLEGIFDSITAAHPEIQWSIVWETNRGCPHHCAYCDWGQHNAKLRQFSMERLLGEIEWMGANGVEFIWCADANFGILERDEALIDALADSRERTGYPHVFLSQTTKSFNERLFRIVEKLHKSGLEKLGPNLAVQTLTPGVLANIGRVNLEDEAISKWIRRCRQAGYRTHTDLILGLPGETLHSFRLSVEKLFELGQHEGFVYYPCALLPNAQMAEPAYRAKHKLRTTRRAFMENALEIEEIKEYVETIDETASMPHADWLTANFFMLLALANHGYGLLRLAAIYLHTERVVSYADFYTRLLEHCHERPDSLLGEVVAIMEKNFTELAHGGDPPPLCLPGFGFGRMMEDMYFFCRAVLEPDRFFAEAEAFLRQFGLEEDFLAELLRYQRESVLLPGAEKKTLEFAYDFPAYFNGVYDGAPVPLQRKTVRLRFSFDVELSSAESYYNNVVRLGHYSNGALYQVDYVRE
ncbi:MAG: radical SAM protein [Oscillospiraceae bacterium]|nr:radical SAM protein [Oscillospiraceae bacterium]